MISDVAMASVTVPDEERRDAEKWQNEIRQWMKRTQRWHERADAVIRRYRDERNQVAANRRRMSTLWSNVQTLAPALFSRAPVPVVERRYLDRDPVGRVAAQMLERALRYTVEDVKIAAAVRLVVMDRLLPGQGQLWVRYDPEFSAGAADARGGLLGSDEQRETPPVLPGASDDEQAAEDAHEDEEEAGAPTFERERICLDYVYWKDFGATSARVWDEVSAVWRRVYLTRAELIERFGEEVGRAVPLDAKPTDLDRQIESINARADTQAQPTKAEVYEIWCRASRSVYWISLHYPGVLDEVPDPLHLESFWPCPRPLLATTTSETIIPIPDYVLYQDQAQEIDDLTQRIALLTSALKVAGVYDSSIAELARLMTEGVENRLIPVKNWASLSEKGGIPGAVSFVPIKEVADVLLGLYQARERVKADLFEVTGMSDIVRGQAQAGSATATEQRIKGQFASLRLQDRQSEVAEFCRDVLRIIAELIAEHYTPETLVRMSGVEFIDNLANLPPKPEPPAGDGQPQPGAPPPEALHQMQMQQWQAQAEQARTQIVTQAIQLLRDEKLRGFRIEVETDSTLQPDPQADKEARVQMLQSAASFIQQAVAASAQAPDLAPLMGKMMLFGLRGFRVGRDLEAAFEDYIEGAAEKLAKAQSAPKPPSPEEVKAQAEQQKAQLELQRMQAQAQIDAQQMQAQSTRDQQAAQLGQQRAQQDAQLAVLGYQIKLADLEIKKQEQAMAMARLQAEARLLAQQHQIEAETAMLNGVQDGA